MGFVNLPFETMALSTITRLKQYFLSFMKHGSLKKLFNLASIELQILMRRERVSGMPYVLKVESTNICDLRCPVCYESRKKHDFDGARGFGRMQPDEFKKIVDQCYPWTYRINLYGFGEPFLFDEIFDMIRYAADRNISVAITSNFNGVDPVKIDKIIESGLEHLVVSIDGVDQKSYEKYRVGGNFEKVIGNVKMLIEEKRRRRAFFPLIGWQYLITRHNVHVRDRAAEMARELGIDIRFSRIGVDFTDTEQCREWLPDENTRKELVFEDQVIKRRETIPICTWLYRTAFINWDLGVSPCCNYYTGDKRHDFGSLKDDSLASIWNGQRYLEARRACTTDNGKPCTDNICGKCVEKRKVMQGRTRKR